MLTTDIFQRPKYFAEGIERTNVEKSNASADDKRPNRLFHSFGRPNVDLRESKLRRLPKFDR